MYDEFIKLLMYNNQIKIMVTRTLAIWIGYPDRFEEKMPLKSFEQTNYN